MRGEAKDGGENKGGRANPEIEGANSRLPGESQRGKTGGEGEIGEGDAEGLPDE